ncbi:uncharacterized protein [Parasteatoda tepidariorum]|uniref:uncharacterized protein n=1 Tax=Parasteatoda tepidariorum TaxID=114398 RepID=UPI0039BC3044
MTEKHCVIGNSTVKNYKASNLRRHYETNHPQFSNHLAPDESTDITDLPQLAVFTSDFVVKEELLDSVALQESTRGADIKNALDSIMKTFDVPLNKLASIATDGALAMLGKKYNTSISSRNLVVKWCSLYKWLEVEWINNLPSFKCNLCVSDKKFNILSSSTGCLISKVDVLKKHELSIDHKHAVENKALMESNAWGKSVAKSISSANESVISAMKIVYMQAKEHLATRKFSSIKDLCIDLGCSSLSGLNIGTASYESYDSIRDMEMALAMTIQEKILH